MQNLLDLLTTGQYLPAIGLVLIALVGAARAGLGSQWPWFKTKVGGYVLGYGSAFVLYIATSLQSGNGISVALLANAIGAGWAAAGGWEHALDVVNALRGKSDGGDKPAELPKAVALGGAASVLAIVALLVGCSSCGPIKHAGDEISDVVIDCSKGPVAEIESLALGYVAHALSGASWKDIGSTALDDAKRIGFDFAGCAFAEAVQFFSGGRKAVSSSASRDASEALEAYRAHVGGASFLVNGKAL